MNSTGKLLAAAAALVSIYAIPGTGLAAHSDAIGKALARAMDARAQGVNPPGEWHGVMQPRTPDGRVNFDPHAPVPTEGARLMWIGSNG